MFRESTIFPRRWRPVQAAVSAKERQGNGWYSHDHKGVHFVGLNNCVQVDAMGNWARINWHG